jgi:ABC-type bacteriocin/lantibiotic exporter with double-glycine peptidase domain
LLATHHRATVRYADRVLAIRDGRVEEVDPADLTLQEDDL